MASRQHRSICEFGGAVGNRTRVHEPSRVSSTCVSDDALSVCRIHRQIQHTLPSHLWIRFRDEDWHPSLNLLLLLCPGYLAGVSFRVRYAARRRAAKCSTSELALKECLAFVLAARHPEHAPTSFRIHVETMSAPQTETYIFCWGKRRPFLGLLSSPQFKYFGSLTTTSILRCSSVISICSSLAIIVIMTARASQKCFWA